MNKNIYKVANKFIKALRGKIDFVNAENFINSKGYKIIFFNTPDGDMELIRCNKKEEAEPNQAFTHCSTANIIFINNNVSSEDKLYLLLHEIGHILLGHVGDGKLHTRNKILIDMEADAFACEVLNPTKKYAAWHLISACLIIIIMLAGYFVIWESIHSDMPVNTNINFATDSPVNMNELVYVTPSGNKYHREDCRYTKDKECIALTREEAQQNYTPCSVCDP